MIDPTPTQNTITMRQYLQDGIDDGDREVMRECLISALHLLDEAAEMYPASITGTRTGPTTHRLVPDPDAPQSDPETGRLDTEAGAAAREATKARVIRTLRYGRDPEPRA